MVTFKTFGSLLYLLTRSTLRQKKINTKCLCQMDRDFPVSKMRDLEMLLNCNDPHCNCTGVYQNRLGGRVQFSPTFEPHFSYDEKHREEVGYALALIWSSLGQNTPQDKTLNSCTVAQGCSGRRTVTPPRKITQLFAGTQEILDPEAQCAALLPC